MVSLSMGSVGHTLLGKAVAGKGFLMDLVEQGNLFFCSWKRGVRKSLRDVPGFIPHHQEEWGCVLGTVLSGIVDKFSKGEMICPFCGGSSTVDPEIHF
jgi:hypothetical protein